MHNQIRVRFLHTTLQEIVDRYNAAMARGQDGCDVEVPKCHQKFVERQLSKTGVFHTVVGWTDEEITDSTLICLSLAPTKELLEKREAER